MEGVIPKKNFVVTCDDLQRKRGEQHEYVLV